MCSFLLDWTVSSGRIKRTKSPLDMTYIVICLKFSESIYYSRWSSAFTSTASSGTHNRRAHEICLAGASNQTIAAGPFWHGFSIASYPCRFKASVFQVVLANPSTFSPPGIFFFLAASLPATPQDICFSGQRLQNALSEFIRVVRQSKKVVNVLQCCASFHPLNLKTTYNSPTFLDQSHLKVWAHQIQRQKVLSSCSSCWCSEFFSISTSPVGQRELALRSHDFLTNWCTSPFGGRWFVLIGIV